MLSTDVVNRHEFRRVDLAGSAGKLPTIAEPSQRNTGDAHTPKLRVVAGWFNPGRADQVLGGFPHLAPSRRRVGSRASDDLAHDAAWQPGQ